MQQASETIAANDSQLCQLRVGRRRRPTARRRQIQASITTGISTCRAATSANWSGWRGRLLAGIFGRRFGTGPADVLARLKRAAEITGAKPFERRL